MVASRRLLEIRRETINDPRWFRGDAVDKSTAVKSWPDYEVRYKLCSAVLGRPGIVCQPVDGKERSIQQGRPAPSLGGRSGRK